MDEKRFKEIKSQMQYMPTEELKKILKDRNFDEWTEEAFEAIERIVDEREKKVEMEDLFVKTIMEGSPKKWVSIAKKLNQINKWSTLSLSMGLFTKAFESFREWRTPELMKNSIPYPLTRVYDVVSEMQIGGPLPEGFIEERYFIMEGPVMVATLDVAFHQDEGLVNFSFILKPKELFKKKAATRVFRDYLIPYVREHVGREDWREFLPGQHFIIDKKRSIVITAKFYFTGPQRYFGFALTELRYSEMRPEKQEFTGEDLLSFKGEKHLEIALKENSIQEVLHKYGKTEDDFKDHYWEFMAIGLGDLSYDIISNPESLSLLFQLKKEGLSLTEIAQRFLKM